PLSRPHTARGENRSVADGYGELVARGRPPVGSGLSNRSDVQNGVPRCQMAGEFPEGEPQRRGASNDTQSTSPDCWNPPTATIRPRAFGRKGTVRVRRRRQRNGTKVGPALHVTWNTERLNSCAR